MREAILGVPTHIALFSSATGEPICEMPIDDYARWPLDMVEGTTARLFHLRDGVRIYLEQDAAAAA